MDKIDFRHRAIIEAHAQLIRFVQRKQMTSEAAAKLAVEHGDALVEAMTVKHEDEGVGHAKPSNSGASRGSDTGPLNQPSGPIVHLGSITSGRSLCGRSGALIDVAAFDLGESNCLNCWELMQTRRNP